MRYSSASLCWISYFISSFSWSLRFICSILTISLDVNKGYDQRPEVRCRLVVQETKNRSTIAVGDIAATFSATPPLEALRFILSLAVTRPPHSDELVLMFIDFSRAHPHTEVTRDVYVWQCLLFPNTGSCHDLRHYIVLCFCRWRQRRQSFRCRRCYWFLNNLR